MDDLMNVVGGDTTINTRGIDVCNPSPEPDYIIDDDGNHHHAPSPSPTNPKPAPGTGNPEIRPTPEMMVTEAEILKILQKIPHRTQVIR